MKIKSLDFFITINEKRIIILKFIKENPNCHQKDLLSKIGYSTSSTDRLCSILNLIGFIDRNTDKSYKINKKGLEVLKKLNKILFILQDKDGGK